MSPLQGACEYNIISKVPSSLCTLLHGVPQFEVACKKAELKEKLSVLRFKLSEDSLRFLPEYKQRLHVCACNCSHAHLHVTLLKSVYTQFKC